MADSFDTNPPSRILDNVIQLNQNNNGCRPGGDKLETFPESTAGPMEDAPQLDEDEEPAGMTGVILTEPCDPDHMEDRFRVDRKKLEQMLLEGGTETGEEFFKRIMEETETHISWPSKLKIGAKSKKDPHIKVTGKLGNVASAKDKIMSVLDTKSNRVTLKMDVSYTEHSHVIGKGGNIIKKVMEDTGCHIHFPDSNRGSQQEKSNQVSIAGQISGVEKARYKIRELLPLVLFFELPISGIPVPDMNSPTIQQIVQTYSVAVNMKQRSRGYSTTVTVRGAANNAAGLKEGTVRLMEHLTGSLGGTLPVSTQIEIAPQHHQFMIGRGGLNIKQIMQSTGASIHFPDPNNAQRKSSVFISGGIDAVIIARHLLMGCLPLVLMFDIKDEVEIESNRLAEMMEQLDVFISVKPKPKQPSKSVIVKSIERNAPNMYLARQKLLGQECESCAAHHAGNHHARGVNGTTLPLPGLNVGSLGLLGQGGVNMNTANLLRLNGMNGMSAVQSVPTSTTNAAMQQGLQTTVPPMMMQQALGSLLRPTNPLQQVGHNPASPIIPSIPTTLTPTISTSLTPGLTTMSITPRLPHTPVPSPRVATSLGAGLHGQTINQAVSSPSPNLHTGSGLHASAINQAVSSPSPNLHTGVASSGLHAHSLNSGVATSSLHAQSLNSGVQPQTVHSASLNPGGVNTLQNTGLHTQSLHPSLTQSPASVHGGVNTLPTTGVHTSSHGLTQSASSIHASLNPTVSLPASLLTHSLSPADITAGLLSTVLNPAQAQQSLTPSVTPTQSRHTTTSQLRSTVNVTNSLQNITPSVPPPLTRILTQNTDPAHHLPDSFDTAFPVGMGSTPVTSNHVSMPRTSPLSVHTNLTSLYQRPPPPLLPPPVTSLASTHKSSLTSPSVPLPVHKPAPPPGFSPRPDPATVSAQLAQLDMGRVSTSALLHNSSVDSTRDLASSVRHSAFVRVASHSRDPGGSRSNTSSSASPRSSPSDSPIDLITMPTTSHLCHNNNKLDMVTKNHPHPPATLMEMLARSKHISPNSSGNFSSGFNAAMDQISPSNSGNFASRLGTHISPNNSGNFSSMFGSGDSGIPRSGSRPSSESGGESDGSDKRAPGCEKRQRERQELLERERVIEQKRQQELDGLIQEESGVSYEQKKLMANKAMKQKPVVTQPRTPTDTWSGLGFSKSMPESAIREARQKNGFSLFQRPALPTMHESSGNEEEASESSWPPETMPLGSEQLQTASQIMAARKRFPYSPLSCSNYIDSTSLPRTTKGLWSNGDFDSNTEEEKQDLSELFIKLGLSKYTSVFQQQEIDLATFSTLTDGDLKELGITTFGARRRMLLAISDLNKNQVKSFKASGSSGSSTLMSSDQTSNLHHYNSNHRNNPFNSPRMNEATASVW